MISYRVQDETEILFGGLKFMNGLLIWEENNFRIWAVPVNERYELMLFRYGLVIVRNMTESVKMIIL